MERLNTSNIDLYPFTQKNKKNNLQLIKQGLFSQIPEEAINKCYAKLVL